jgi:hypothetical protein
MDTEINRQGVALPRRTAHDQVMSDAIRQATAAQIAKHRRLLRSGRDGRILSALMFKPRRSASGRPVEATAPTSSHYIRRTSTENVRCTLAGCPAKRKSKSCTATGSRPKFRL